MDLINWGNWILKHWIELAALLGIGGGSGLAGSKLMGKNQDRLIADIDEKQNKKIAEVEGKIADIDKALMEVKNDIATNTLFDKQFREQMEKDRQALQASMNDIKGNVDRILNHLLNAKQ